eukprot:jgi/Picre1/30456/NNA_005820.t1
MSFILSSPLESACLASRKRAAEDSTADISSSSMKSKKDAQSTRECSREPPVRQNKASAGRALRVTVRAEEKAKEAEKPWAPPALDPNTPSPIFGGSTGGLLRQAQVEEFHVITWESKKEQIFEMPTGGAAIMREGPNLLKLARKEQCLALLTQLRTKFKINGFIYRVFPNGEVQYLHPKNGVYPEKVNAGRVGATRT